MTTRALMPVALLTVTSAVYAEDGNLLLNGLLAAEHSQWREVKTDMSAEEYRDVYRHNRRLVRDQLKNTVVSLGIPKSGLAGACKSAVLKMVMRSRFKVKAPPGAGEVPERAELGELTEEWTRVRGDWRDFVAGFPGELAGRAVYKHPVAGRLSLDQALGFLIEHLARHMGQLERTLRAVA